MRIGHGYDVHKLVEGRELILGGEQIPHTLGLDGHSDADVVLHAICDALLGAIGKGDIGQHFPDNDDQYKGIDSRKLLREVFSLVHKENYQLGNLDITIIAQAPKLASWLPKMRHNIAADLKTSEDRINLKATTTEKLGFAGREEGIEAHAVVLLQDSSS